MAGRCIEKLPHSCGSHDALQIYLDNQGKYSGYCHACNTYVPSPYKEGNAPAIKKTEKTKEEIKEEIEEVSILPVVSLPDRKLEKDSLDYFDIKISLSEQDGTTPVLHHYPYYKAGEVVGYKNRLITGKTFWSTGDIKKAEPFGWKQALETGARTLYITEGELDAVALFQALKNKAKGTRYAEYNPAVVSVKNGSSSAKKDLSAFASTLQNNFQEIVLVFDQDKAGKQAVEEVVQVIPYIQTVTIPGKDPNECVIKGHSLALCNAVLFKKNKPKNTRLILGTDLISSARKETKMGLSWPWPGLTKLTRGIRFGETVYLGSGVKMGKTTLVTKLIAHLIIEHSLKVLCVQPEEPIDKTFRLVTGQVAHRIFNDPEIPFDYEAYDKAAPVVGEKLVLLNLYQNLEWNVLRGDIISAVNDGCRAVFIDPITNLTNGIDAATANVVLQEFAQELAYLAKDLSIIIFLFCHLKAPASGLPHERGGTIYSSQFAGSRAMMRSCHLMLGLEGNKDPNLPQEERNTRKLVILEDRAYGATGYIPLYFDIKTGIYHEMKVET